MCIRDREVPLRALTVVGCRQGHDAAHAGVQPLRDALDRAALARRVAAFEQDQHLLAAGSHPVLQLDELGLQPEQLAEVQVARHLVGAIDSAPDGAGFQRHAVFELEFQFLVEVVSQLCVKAGDQVVVHGRRFVGIRHGCRPFGSVRWGVRVLQSQRRVAVTSRAVYQDLLEMSTCMPAPVARLPGPRSLSEEGARYSPPMSLA